jgi:NAD(P)H dehydrogenase (quinone)
MSARFERRFVMIVVTGATGKLGQLVVQQLLERLPATQIGVAVRNPDKARELTERGVRVRRADYDDPSTLRGAFEGAHKVLLISSNEVGRRQVQHEAVVDAAKQVGVEELVYTSILHADRSPLALAREHLATERYIQASGLPYVFLRNGWYFENYTEHLAPALAHGAILGSAGEARIAAASRADYAAAAVAVLTGQGHAKRVYELAGDEAFTLGQLANELARQSGKSVVYSDLPPDQYRAALLSVGVPEGFAEVLVDSDVGASKGGLEDLGRQLSRLIGRTTTSLSRAVAAGLEQTNA